MEYTEIGKTGTEVSVLGLGAGGASRLGLGVDESEDHARRVVETALDLGITLIDTAEAYQTESVVGDAVADSREDVVISTKVSLYDGEGELRPPEAIGERLDASLKRLGTDYVDIYHLHGVNPVDYDYAAESLRPALETLKREGKIKHTGITETVGNDPGHEMLSRAVADGWPDVVMVGFNLLNHSARDRVLAPAAEQGIGTIGMIPLRRALTDPEYLTETVRELIDLGELDPDAVDPGDPFGFLVHEDGATSLADAALRFARHERTVDTVLTGTSNIEHLRSNLRSALREPLPGKDLARLQELFGDVESRIGN